jgi:hypothetical protein
MFNNDWAAVDTGDTVTYLRRVDGRWRVGGSVREGLTLTYETFANGLPGSIAIRSRRRATDTALLADIRLRVSQLEINVPVEAKAFELDVPADAEPLSIEELRRSGPLGERR